MSNVNPLRLAGLLHDEYFRLAPSFGVKANQDKRKFRPTSPHGRLLRAVCEKLLKTINPENTDVEPV